ncbi:MAG: tripartite tricarboxylate transporter substrate binding protein [Sulfuritalea sp.]|nr:tripartite tricarboxylate transporter substrate binding protein [Sulfuritalea sp.]
MSKFFAAVVFVCGAAAALAQPVSFIVPFAPGGGGDSIARILGQKMSESLGNPVIIENHPGAGGVVGLETMVRAADANLTLGLLSTGALLAALEYRPALLEGLQLVSPLGIAGMVIVSSKDATIADLLERIRRGQKAFFGAGEPGSVSHLCFDQLLKGAGRKATTDLIPFKGNAPLLVAVMSGYIDAACVDIASAIPHIKAGKLRALALTLPHPDEQLPGVPTLESVGVTGVLAGGWYAMIAPKRMSPTALHGMVASLKKAFSDPQVQARLRNVLTDPIAADEVGPGIADQFMQRQIAQLRPYAALLARENTVSPGASSPVAGVAPSPRLADPGAKQLREPAKPGASVATVAPQPARDGSARSAADIAAARTCDRQCALLVAETKCKHIRDARENLSCLMQNGTGRDDSPEICAQAKALTGCVTKKEKENARPSVASRSGGRYDSVCERNLKKIDYAMQDSRLVMAAATYDLFMKDIHWYTAKIFEPCTGSNADAAGQYKDAMESYNKVSQYCARPHASYECTRWGPSGGVSDNGGNPFNNPAWYAKWKSEVDQALSNPEYSAELGSIKGSGAGTGVDAACAAGLKKIKSQYAAAKHHIPAKSVVVLSEANMWMAARSIETIESQCPQSEKYKAEAGRLRSQYRDIKRACDASASAGACIARLPGKEPAPVPPGNSLPPLRKESLKEDCSGANWLQCRRKECKERQGTFSTDKKGCAWCIADAGNWTRCPAGSGGVSSGQ